jgi:hypothetical protein
MEKGLYVEPGFPCLPAALVNRRDRDHRDSANVLQDSRWPSAASTSITKSAIWVRTSPMKLLRHLHRTRIPFQQRDRFIRKANDSTIIATLLLLVLTAIVTAPGSTAEANQKLQALLLVQGMPEWIASTEAVGRHVPVWP